MILSENLLQSDTFLPVFSQLYLFYFNCIVLMSLLD